VAAPLTANAATLFLASLADAWTVTPSVPTPPLVILLKFAAVAAPLAGAYGALAAVVLLSRGRTR